MSSAVGPTSPLLVAHLRRLRLRAILARLGDAAVIGGGAGAAAVLINLLAGSPFSPVPLLVIVAVLITLLPLVRPPTLVETAMRVDDENRLNDLLSSALLTSDRDDDWCRILRMQAEATLDSLVTPRLNRFGLRVHAACWMIAAAVLVAAMVGRSMGSRDARLLASVAESANSGARSDLTRLNRAGGIRAREAESEMNLPGADHATPSGSGDHRAAAGEAADGRGAGRANSIDMSPTLPRDLVQSDASGSNGTVRGGASGRATDGSGDRSTRHGVVRDDSASRRVAPWMTDAWPERRAAALSAVDAGRVPDAYRDLVRDYFDR